MTIYIKDVDAIVEVLLRRYDFDNEYLVVLKNEEATRKRIINALHNYTKKSILGEHDSLLIYFAGHGILDDNQDGYWIPVESERGDISSFIPNQDIIGQIKNMKCRHVLLISDSCFSGSLLVSDRDESTYNLVARELDAKKSRWVITSGGHDEKVQDGTDNSPFAKAIISELNSNNKHTLIADELALRIRHITRANAPQIPQSGRLYGLGDALGQFIFKLRANEVNDWESALNLGSVLPLLKYLEKYPIGQFTATALSLIHTLYEQCDLERQQLAKEVKEMAGKNAPKRIIWPPLQKTPVVLLFFKDNVKTQAIHSAAVKNTLVDAKIIFDEGMEKMAEALLEFSDNLVLFHFGGYFDQIERIYKIGSVQFSRLLISDNTPVPFVFLNGYPVYGQDYVGILVAKGVKAIIVTNAELNDEETLGLVYCFYQFFFKNATLRKAFENAQTMATFISNDIYSGWGNYNPSIVTVNPGDTDNKQPISAFWMLFVNSFHTKVLDWTLQDFVDDYKKLS